MSPNLSTMITQLKFRYLDPNNISIRQFAKTTGIRRVRLERLLYARESATVEEFVIINDAIGATEVKRQHNQNKADLKLIKSKLDGILPHI
jgi:plasmid maintenance system antidote protein VapI